MRNLQFSVFALFLFFFLSIKTCVAYEVEVPYFVNDFTSIETLSDSVWNQENIGGQIELNNGLNLSSGINAHFPFITSKTNIFPPQGNFYVRVAFKYQETTDYGVGFGFGNLDPGYDITDWTNISDTELVKFQVWQGTAEKLNIETRRCNNNVSCESVRIPIYKTEPDINTHTIFLKNIDGVTTVYFDDIKTGSSPIENTYWRPTVFWMGNPSRQSSKNWTDLTIMKIEIGYINEYQEKIKNILIPGLGASWDVGAILAGSDAGDWQIPSFVHVYDGLTNSFIEAGYSDTGENKNLYIFPYDWRRPIDVLADRLKIYIDNMNLPAGQKINLVGHSMGGLVARAYAQKYGVSKIEKVVTIGSPNMGTVKAYGIWEGATLWDGAWWGKLALDLTTHFGAVDGETRINTIRRLTPGIKDLLPTYDFLKREDTILPWNLLTERNDYLNNLNQNITLINPLTTAIFSKDIQTGSVIKTVPHSLSDLDMWIDGKPISIDPFENSSGDGTVTESSAKGTFTNTLQGNGWHDELVTKVTNIQKLFGVLGLDPDKAIAGTDDSRKEVFVAALRSPGTLEVCNIEMTKCNDSLGLYFPEYKLFIFPGYANENLRVKVLEDGLGDYKLHLGDIDETSNWIVVGGNLSQDNQVDLYKITSVGQGVGAELVDTIKPAFVGKTLFNGWYKTPQISFFKYDDLNLKSDYTDPNCVISTEGVGRICEVLPNVCDKSDNCNTESQISNGVDLDLTPPVSTFSLPVISNNWGGSISGTATDSLSGVSAVDLIIKDPKGSVITVRASGTANWNYTVPNLVDGKYAIKSRAIDTAGNVEIGLVTHEITLDTNAPKSPRVVFAYDWSQRIFMGWLPVKTAVKYRVFYGQKKNALVNIVETRYPHYISNILPAGKYYLVVTAVDAAGNESVKSNIVDVKIDKKLKWW